MAGPFYLLVDVQCGNTMTKNPCISEEKVPNGLSRNGCEAYRLLTFSTALVIKSSLSPTSMIPWDFIFTRAVKSGARKDKRHEV